MFDEIVVANSDAIKQMKQEISWMRREKNTNEEDSNTIVGEDLNPIREIVVQQQSIDKTIVENSDAIKLLDEEITRIVSDKSKKDLKKKEVDKAIERLNVEIEQIRKVERESAEEVPNLDDKKKKDKKCKHFNVGHCKYKMKCRFTHPKEVCKEYSEGKCNDTINCPHRHPKPCKWFKSSSGCSRGETCDFSHDTFVYGDQRNDTKVFKCVGCSYDWKERWCVVEHKAKNMQLYFCLNCDDWIKDKSKVLDQGWSLFNQDGNLNHLV